MLSSDLTELTDFVEVVVVWNKARLAWVAVLAQVNGSAFYSVGVSSGLVDGASLISDLISVHEVKGTETKATITAVIKLRAGYDDLGRDVDVWPSTLSVDLNSV